MKEIKKLMITLVALLALTTGAWADGIVCTASDLGKVLCTDGSIYENVSAATTAGKTAAAMIAYVDETNKNGLALALTDEDAMTWDNSAPSNKGKTAPELCSALNTSKAVTGGTWKLPSQDEWKQMFSANGGNEGSYSGLNTAIGNAGGTALLESEEYWSSSEVYDDARLVSLADGNASWGTEGKHYQRCVRACLAFDIAASSGPKVAWNKAEKTGTFTMPGGNVTLEPEYYPQAALTAAPTAINDVPATTDGAIVKAGTVANIGSTETAQGTVMYYVSQTALDDAALLALAADKWTADVPTAEKLTKGEAYVYYYVRGNDSDTDEENFSDGDILAANALTVTIAAEPTYAVTFAEGTDPNEWTADPAADVKKGQTVTVTYTGAKKVIGVKAEKKASTVPVTAITLNKTATTITMISGTATETLSVTAVTPDEATDKTYTWSSDDITKATVDQNGVVTAVAEGTAHIRATANDGSGVYGECTVTVSDLSAYYSNMVECGCDMLDGKCWNGGSNTFTGQVLSAAQAIALAQAKAAETSSNCAVFYGGEMGQVKFAKNDGTTGSAKFYYDASGKGLTGYRGFYVSK